MGKRDQDWLILRTSGQRTLPLARSLTAAGIEAWTPTDVITKRKPRSTKETDREVAITPTFVFVRAHRLLDLALICALPVNPHPSFSIFRWDNRIPLIADREIASLRADEQTRRDRRELAKRKQERRSFEIGSAVTTDQPAFLGLTGVVETCDGKQAWVHFGGSLRVKISTWQIEQDQVRAA